MLPNDPDPPLSFERIARAQFAGCLAYGLLIPVGGCVGGLLTGMIGYGLGSLAGLQGNEGAWLPLILFPVGFFAVLVWGFREFQRRARGRIEIYRDRIEVSGGRTPLIFRFEDLDWIEGVGIAATLPILNPSGTVVRLRRKDGKVLPLIIEEWPVKEIAQGLIDRAVPVMARLFNERIDAGEAIEFRPGALRSLRFLVTGILFTTGGAALFYAWWTSGRKESWRLFGLPLLLMLTGISALIMVRKARGGILVDRDGVRRSWGGDLVPWNAIQRLHLLPDAANIETQDGNTLTVGSFARNYEACVALLKSRIKQ